MRRPTLALCLLALLALSSTDASAQVAVTASAGTPAGSYTTLKDAFDAINLGTHQGVIAIALTGDTTETASAVLNGSGTGGASYTSVQITPSGGAARAITGAIVAGSPLIDLNGADNVTIDGLNSGGNALTISNTTASATSGTSTIRFIGGATSNTIKNCNLQGSVSSSVATNGAVIFFSTDAVTASGNDNNTISNNNIGPAGANLPSKAILCNGSTTTTAIGNSGIVIDNNNIFDFFGAAVTSAGVAVNGGCNGSSITNNRFYQTGTRTWTTGALHNAILLNSSTATSGVQGFTVTGNIVGFASNTQTGTYTLTGSTGKFVGIQFNGITGGTASNISSNTVASVSLTGVTSSGTSTSSPMAGIIVVNGVANTTSNTIGSQTLAGSLTFSTTTTSSTDTYGIFNFSLDDWTANSNSIGGISVTNLGASGTFVLYGMRANTSTTKVFNAASNSVGGTVANSVQLTSTGAASQVVGMATSNAIATWTSNTIRNLTTNNGTGTTTTASMIGMLLTTTTPSQTVSQNTIFGLTNTSTTLATVVTGIQFTGGTANVVARNSIYGLTTATNSAAAEVNGIRVAGGTTIYRNNMIAVGDGIANAIGTGSTTGGVNGINEPAGTNSFFHNSVYVGGSPTAGVGPSCAFNSSVLTNTRSFRDNIFFNARTNSGATGKHYAIRVGGTTPNPTGLTSNNNILLASGSGGLTGLFNLVDQPTLAAWQAATGQDGGSFALDPKFLAPTAATPDLHIDGTVLTPIEGNGFAIGSVTDDFDGQTRSGLTPTDIGADAGNFLGVDLSAPAIAYTAFGNTASTANRTLAMTLTDGTGSATGGLAPRIYYRKGAGAYFSQACALSGGTVTNGTWDCTIVSADLGGVTTADVISYFVIAQDTLGNIGSSPAGAVATDVNNVTAPPAAPNTYTIVPAFSGSFDVGSGQTYTSLTNAGGLFEAINGGALTGSVVINLVSDLSGELGTNALNQWAEDGVGGYTLTIRPAGAARLVTGTIAGALIRLNGADRVTIDGSVGGGGTDRSLTIQNTSTSTSAAVIAVMSGTNGAQNDTIKNVNVLGQDPTTTLAGIALGGNTVGTVGTDNDGNRIENCSVRRAIFGIYSAGQSAANPNTGTVITRNDLTGTGADRIRRVGILVFNDDGVQITENSLGGIDTNESADAVGIGVGTQGVDNATTTSGGVSNALVSRNRINGVLASSTIGFSAAGITVAGGSAGPNTVQNNTISGVISPATSPDLVAGIFVAGATGSSTRLYHNSVALSGDRGAVASQSPGFALAITGTDPTVVSKDNIFSTTQTSSGGGASAKSYSIGTVTTTFTNLDSNYNDFVSAGANAGFFRSGSLAGASGTDYANLAAWSAAVSDDANSLEANPLFISSTDLHIDTSGGPSPVEAAGTPVMVTLDFEGDTRSTGTPTIGADEVPAAPTGLTATPGNAHVLLGWNVVPGSTYTVKRATVSGGPYGTVASNVAANSYDDMGLLNGTPYFYVVSAAGNGPAGRNSAEATATPEAPPAAPLGLSATPGDTQITLSWMASAGAASYNVKRSLVSGGPYATVASGILTTGHVDTGLTNGVPYYYVVSAVGIGGEGADSAEATATPRVPTADLTISKSDGVATTATGQPTTYTITVSNLGPDPASGATVTDTFPALCDSVTWTCSGAGGGACASPGSGNIGASVNLPVGGSVTYLATCNVNSGASGSLVNTASVAPPLGVTDPMGGNNSATDADTLVTIGISVNDVTQMEGNSGTTAYAFTVSLSSPSGVVTTVDYATADGTATTADSDYTATSGSLTFGVGETTKMVTVQANGDAKYEADETFVLNLTNAVNAAVLDGQGTGTLTDEDAQPTLSVNDVTLAEGNSGTTAFAFTVSLSAASGLPTTVGYATADGTATTADSDYAAASGTLTIAAGSTGGTVTVNASGDTKFETSETFVVNLASPTNATILDGQGQGTLTNDDSQPTLSINDLTAAEGNSGTTPFAFTVSLSNTSYQAITVAYATADGTATTADSDYAAAAGTLTIAAGSTGGTVTVNASGDTRFETSETFFVNLASPTNATILDSQGQGTLTNDDSQPTLSINDLTAAEGNSGTTPFAFTVSLSNTSYQAITVAYATADGTATTADSDYAAAAGTLTIAAGSTGGTVTVNASGDTRFETSETFFVNLASPTNATILDSQGQGTLTNDDSQPTLSINDLTAAEGNSGTTPFAFTVSLSNTSYQAITVAYATADGTATTADSDYAATSGTLTIAAGSTGGTVTINASGDTKFETNETFVVNLASPTNATILDSQGQGTLTNDDAQPTLSIGDASAAEGNSGTTPLTFTVSLSNASYQTITVARATADGTATTADSDYAAASGTLTFAPGTTSQTFAVNVNGDVKYENNETFVVDLSAPANATLSDGQATGTITNDDAQPSLAVTDVSRPEGNSGSSNSTFTVSISNPSFQAVTVAFATADGTATVADSDYTAASGSLTFPAGSTASLSINVAVIGDVKLESNEAFNVNLSSPAGATLADAQGVGTIQNDDGQPTLTIADVEKPEGNSGNTAFDFTLTLSNPSGFPVTVNYATADGPPALPVAALSSVTADPQGRFVYVTVPGSTAVLAFSVDGKTGDLQPAAEQAPGEGPRAAVLDGLPRFAYVQRVSGATSVNAVLGEAGALRPVPGPEFGQVGAVAATADGKFAYVAAADRPELAGYLVDGATGLLAAVPGSPYALPWSADALRVERTGRFAYALHTGASRISGFRIDPLSGALQSIPGSPFDGSRGPIALALDPHGRFAWALTRGGDVISYRIDPGSGALVAEDSVASAGSAAALAVDSEGSFLYVAHRKLAQVSAFRVEPDSGRLTAVVGSPFAVGSEPVALAVHPSGSFLYVVEESARQISGFAVDRANGALTPLDRSPFATNATAPATAGEDYQAASGTLTIPAGSTTTTLTVQVFGDFKYEPDEVFTINLSAPSGATLARTQAAGTIDDDERARMVSPVPGTTFASPSVTFNWTAGSQATGYWLDLGTTPGATNLYSAAQSGLTATVSGLPANGQPIYVRLWTQVPAPAGWVYFDYTYTAVTPILAQMVTPVPGTILPGNSATFTWTAGAGITRYFLDIGSSKGGKDIYTQDQGTSLSVAVNTLPVDGRVVWVRLWSFVSGKAGWAYVDYQYTANTWIAVLVLPNPGSTLTPTTTFTWTPGVGALQYWLSVGNKQGGANIYDGNQALGLTATVSGIPTTEVWVRLFTRLPGLGWVYQDYRFNY